MWLSYEPSSHRDLRAHSRLEVPIALTVASPCAPACG